MTLFANRPTQTVAATRRTRPDPDPIAELATIDDKNPNNNPDRPHLAQQPGPQPGFGPDEVTPPKFEGNPELGIDPIEAAARTGKGI